MQENVMFDNAQVLSRSTSDTKLHVNGCWDLL